MRVISPNPREHDARSISPLARIVQIGAAFAGSNLARAAISFVTSLVVARGLGREGFGSWTLLTAWAAALTALLDLGFGVLLTRDTAREGRAGSLIGNALAIRLSLFVPAAVLFHLGASRIGIAGDFNAASNALTWLAAASIAYGCFGAVFRGWPTRVIAILGVETAGAALQLAGSVAVIAAGGGVRALLVLAGTIQATQVLAAAILYHAARPDDRIERPTVRSAFTLLRRALPFGLTGLVANAQARLAPLLLGYLSVTTEVAWFGVAAKLGNLARLLPSAAFAGALPVFAQEENRGRAHEIRSRFDMVLRLFVIATGAAAVAGAQPIVRLTYGDAFAGAVPVLRWVGIGLIPTLINSGRKVYLYAVGRERVALLWSTVALALQGAACAALIPSFGARGGAIALAFGEVVVWMPLRAADKALARSIREADVSVVA